jgi:hypothetical protein
MALVCALVQLLVHQWPRTLCEIPMILHPLPVYRTGMVKLVALLDQAIGMSAYLQDYNKEHTPIGPYVRNITFLAFFKAWPEYLTTLWIVKAGKPIEAID